jgi:hypothetical protein
LFSINEWDINILVEMVNGMKVKWFVIGVLVLGCLLSINAFPSQAQKSPKTLTFLYSNNINGEIDPCPT